MRTHLSKWDINARSRGSIITLTILTWLLLIGTTAQAADVVSFSLPEFVSAEPQLRNFEGKVIRVEGRYEQFTPNALRFKNCPIYFYLPANTKRPLSRSRNIAVTGELKKDADGYRVLVDSIQARPPIIETIQLSRNLLPDNDAQPWLELGKQAISTATFYQDNLLQKVATEILLEGFRIKKASRVQMSVAFLQDLAAEAAEIGVPETFQRSLEHQALLLELQEGTKKPGFNYLDLRKRTQAKLTGSTVPLTSLEGSVFERYNKDPQGVFQAATPHAQQQLSRVFLIDVLRAEFRSRLDPSGANGDELAKLYAPLAPEDKIFVDELRGAALEFRTKNLLQLSRAEAIAVVSRFREQGDDGLADTAMKRWLQHRRTLLPQGGPSDYLQMALDQESLLKDRKTAESIALEGIRRFPKDVALATLLRRWNYEQQADQWKKKDELAGAHPPEIKSQIAAGMTREQVAGVLGSPQQITRLAAQGKSNLLWHFPDVKLVIRMERSSRLDDFVVQEVLSTR